MKVAVVGCGLAGLRSAMLLEARGHEVDLYEARDRAGGRLHTAPSGFEEGAEWIDEDHERMRALLRDLGIAEVPAPPGEYLLLFQKNRCSESSLWPDAAADAARFEAMARTALPSDAQTLGDLVRAACHSEEGRWLVSAQIRTDEGDEPDRLGLAQWLKFRQIYAERSGREGSAYRIDGGGSRLVQAMLARLRAKPRYGSKLIAVREDGGVSLRFEGFAASADAAILALPLPCLLEIDVDPPLASAPHLAKLGFAPALKARYRFASAVWEGQGWQGYMKTDLLFQQTWPDRADPEALIAYIVGDSARTLNQLSETEMILSSEWARWSMSWMPYSVEVKNWTADEFSRGAFALALPGSNPEAVRLRDDRRVQVAGEFCAEWLGFMEGALESAEAAVGALGS